MTTETAHQIYVELRIWCPPVTPAYSRWGFCNSIANGPARLDPFTRCRTCFQGYHDIIAKPVLASNISSSRVTSNAYTRSDLSCLYVLGRSKESSCTVKPSLSIIILVDGHRKNKLQISIQPVGKPATKPPCSNRSLIECRSGAWTRE